MPAPRLDTIVLGFHETLLPPLLRELPADNPLGFYYRTAVVRMHGADVEPHTALSRIHNAVSGNRGRLVATRSPASKRCAPACTCKLPDSRSIR